MKLKAFYNQIEIFRIALYHNLKTNKRRLSIKLIHYLERSLGKIVTLRLLNTLECLNF